jgi:hypothetical protein
VIAPDFAARSEIEINVLPGWLGPVPESMCTLEHSEKRHFHGENATQPSWLRCTAILEPL